MIKDQKSFTAQRAEPVRRTPEIIKELMIPNINPNPGKNCHAGEAIRLGAMQLCLLCTMPSLCKSFAECILSTESP